MPAFIDLTKRKFGRLTVISRAENTKSGHPKWSCRCDCGEIVIVTGTSLRSGHTKSCGCFQIDVISRHGMVSSPEYSTWKSMKARCTNKNAQHFHRYGGRGITVCERWLTSFSAFLADMGPRPDGGTLDRIDNNLGYFPENCRWATRREQANNTARNRQLIFKGESRTVSQWASLLGINVRTLHYRLNSGWSLERALTTKVRKQG